MAKKNKHSALYWSLLAIILLLLIVALILLLVYFLKRNSNKDKYYFTFKKGDLWEDATFELIPKDDYSTGYVTTFTQEEKDMYTEKLKEWKQRFPSVRNGNLVYLFSGNGPTQLFVNPVSLLGVGCFGEKIAQCFRMLKLQKSSVSTIEKLKDGYFHVCNDSSFSIVQSIARDSWGLSDDFTQTLISPAYKCNRKSSECIQGNPGDVCPEEITCSDWDNESNVFSVLAGSTCMNTGFTGIWPCDEISGGCQAFEPSEKDDYKMNLSGKNKKFSKDLLSKIVTTQFVLKNIAVKKDDQQYLDELIEFLKRINKTVIFFNVYFEIHDTPTTISGDLVYDYRNDKLSIVKSSDSPEQNNSRSFYFIAP